MEGLFTGLLAILYGPSNYGAAWAWLKINCSNLIVFLTLTCGKEGREGRRKGRVKPVTVEGKGEEGKGPHRVIRGCLAEACIGYEWGHLPDSGGSMLGPRGTGPQILPRHPNFYCTIGHSSSATG